MDAEDRRREAVYDLHAHITQVARGIVAQDGVEDTPRLLTAAEAFSAITGYTPAEFLDQ